MTDISDIPLPPLRPVTFAGTAGLLHLPAREGHAEVGIVIVEPWGFDALSLRRALRILADRLAGLGYPVLRYDQPGSGDALSTAADVVGLDPFREALSSACDTLQAETGVVRVAVIGLGLGAPLAAEWARAAPETAAGLVLLAPVLRGRAFLRELQLRAAMIGEMTGSPPEVGEGEALVVAGLPMSAGLADELRGMALTPETVPQGLAVQVLARPDASAEEDFARAIGARPGCSGGTFAGYADAVSDPTLSVPPEGDCTAITRFLARNIPVRRNEMPETAHRAMTGVVGAVQAGNGFRERFCVFGPDEALVGVWCEPTRVTGMARCDVRPVILLGAGGNPRAGWARGGTFAARVLALAGIPSLRFDLADVGDSRARAAGPEVVHYHGGQVAELSAALDLCQLWWGGDAAVVVGSCGGAYLALNGAVADPRVGHVIAVNLQRFLWDPRDDVGEVLRLGNVSASAYGRKLFDTEKLRRLVAGKVALGAIVLDLSRRAFRESERRLAPWLFGLLPFSRLFARVHQGLASLAARDVKVELVFSEGDPGLDQLDIFFGRSHARLAAYPNVSVMTLPGADHNLTHIADRAPVLARAAAAARRVQSASRIQAAE
ncbi:serine aminopeptidase domain-containing protein [Stappia sp.]|uniref:serine aminopeptidase domain-containing protein n=1 Tax=Stappia sp. TaxID=1870903 RepID=UPI003A997FD0